MWDNLAYERRGDFLHSVHTTVNLVYIAALFILTMISDHPLFLIGAFLITALALAGAGALAKGESLLRAGIWATLLIMAINPLVIHAGATVLWSGLGLPVLGRVEISLEPLCYGAVMGVRLMTLMLVFCLCNEIVDPDRLLCHMSRFAYQSGLMVSLATRLFPSVLRDLSAAAEAQQLRGVDFGAGNLRERIRKYSRVFRVVMVSTLEGSFQTAEAMQARAFGAGPRSCYSRELWRPRDLLCLAASLLSLTMAVYAKIRGYCDFIYYPRLGRLVEDPAVIIWLGMMALCLLLPVAVGWGWKRCPFLRSKI